MNNGSARKLLRVGVSLLAQLSLAIPSTSSRAEQFSKYDHFDGFFFLSGERFYDLCTENNEVSQQLCQAYICGTFDAWAAQNIVKHTTVYSICVKPKATCEELADTVVSGLTEKPELRQSAPAGAIGYILSRAFPCK